MAEALYRKYRPQVFGDVVGQGHIETTLRHAIERDKVSHAYLFCGPRGTGKTTMARLLAKALICPNAQASLADNSCDDCRMVTAGEHPDVYELDAASRTGVDNVREEIIGRVNFAPTRGAWKIYIIDEVHMLSTAAFNALLKTLEEPPGHVLFVLCTTDPQKVPETIHSRCQRFDFHQISQEDIIGRLAYVCESEGVPFEREALLAVARQAQGGMRNALTCLEQLMAFGQGSVTLQAAREMLGETDAGQVASLAEAIGRSDAAACFAWVADFAQGGQDLARFAADLAGHVRNLYMMAVAGADVPLEVSDAEREVLRSQLPLFGTERLSRLMGVLGDLMVELRTAPNARLSFEIALTRMVRPESDLTLEALAQRVEALERALAQGLAMPVAQGQGADTRPVTPASPVAAVGREAGERPAVQVESAAPASPAHSPARAEALPAMPERQGAAAKAEAKPQPKAAAPGQFSQAAISRGWDHVLSALKKEKAAYGALFLGTQAVYDEATGTMQVVFSPKTEFAFRAVRKPEIEGFLAQVIARVYGASIAFTFVKGEGSASLAQGAASAQASAAAPQPQRPRRQVAEKPASGPQPQPQPAVEPRSAPEPQPTPAPQPAAPQGDYVYAGDDDVVPYEDEYVPYDEYDDPYADEPVPYRFDIPVEVAGDLRTTESQALDPQASEPQAPSPVEAQGSSSPARAETSSAPQGSPGAEGDLSSFLAGFGDGVIVREI